MRKKGQQAGREGGRGAGGSTHLHPGIDFNKEMPPLLVHQKLHRARTQVLGRACQTQGIGKHGFARLLAQTLGGRHLHHLGGRKEGGREGGKNGGVSTQVFGYACQTQRIGKHGFVRLFAQTLRRGHLHHLGREGREGGREGGIEVK